jgi:outer membrane lipoprotein-sorting protein
MQINRMATLFVFALAALATPLGAATQHSLEDVLAGMDDVSREFRDMAADIEREQVVVFINESSFESGRMYFVRRGEGSRIRVSILEPAPKDLLIDDGQVGVYNPLINVLQETGLGEHEDKVEFMVLGFGTSRDDLLAYYEVAYVGEEPLDGRMLSVLDLVPRDPAVARQFTGDPAWWGLPHHSVFEHPHQHRAARLCVRSGFAR